MSDCMVCDLYKVIDDRGDLGSGFVAGLVTVLPPRGHAFHNLAILGQTYRTPPTVEMTPITNLM
jgi:hypothetical protein